jgi:hypothetical protein
MMKYKIRMGSPDIWGKHEGDLDAGKRLNHNLDLIAFTS